MMGMGLMFGLLAVLLVIWVLRRNAQDRDTFEKELEDELREDGDTAD